MIFRVNVLAVVSEVRSLRGLTTTKHWSLASLPLLAVLSSSAYLDACGDAADVRRSHGRGGQER
jgi:hypothetical protein